MLFFDTEKNFKKAKKQTASAAAAPSLISKSNPLYSASLFFQRISNLRSGVTK